MSVVARQGFKYTVIGYLGFILGALSTYFVFPYDFAFYGKLSYILTTAEIMVPVVVFGLSYANVKFFHQTQKEGKHQNVLSLSLAGILFNFGVFTALFLLFHYLFPEYKQEAWWKLKYIILALVLVLAISHVLNRYVSNYKRIVVPNIFENIFPKLANLGAFCLFIFLGMSQPTAFGFFFAMFTMSTIGYFVYANSLNSKLRVLLRNYKLSVTLQDDGRKEGYFTGDIENKTMSHYITLPLLAVFRPSDKWDVFGGFYLSWAFSRKFVGKAHNGSIRETPLHDRIAVRNGTYDYSSDIRKYDIGAKVGAAYYISKKVSIQAEVQIGFIDQLDPSTRKIDQSLYNVFLNIGAAYRL